MNNKINSVSAKIFLRDYRELGSVAKLAGKYGISLQLAARKILALGGTLRPRGQPKLLPGRKKIGQGIAFSPRTLAKIKGIAEREGRSISEIVEERLEKMT